MTPRELAFDVAAGALMREYAKLSKDNSNVSRRQRIAIAKLAIKLAAKAKFDYAPFWIEDDADLIFPRPKAKEG